ncbi:ExeA family protein [Stieleria varia]|uniref:ORC1/DEAH AAA+ ATPase domain-containing protein n=1 Tax=Stieleria varia TaxID=2528005 RepID=A0A5C6ATL6_9BACT|nr:AAA family ATPase [Stieleria varia]TWU02751.1 hypothetical protein Pla52n_38100 [Stieleria varia]
MKNFDNDFTLPPFPAFPCVSRFVPIGSVNESLERISRSVRAHESLISVIGPPGTGKSLLCGVIAQRFSATHDIVVLGETPILDEKTLRRQMLNRLGVALENHRDDDFQSMMEQRINGPMGKPCGLLLVIDEAQTLTEDLLESIRMLTNIMREGQPRVTAIVVGGVKLDEMLAAPSMNGFAQRIATRCYLHPMNAGETRTYIRDAIEQCGAEPDGTITDGAIAAIHHAASGVPRLVNQMMTEAIDCAADGNQQLIDDSVVDRAWAQLQQLPSPMMEEPRLVGESSTIEFGTLDDTPMGDSFGQQQVVESSSEECCDEVCETATPCEEEVVCSSDTNVPAEYNEVSELETPIDFETPFFDCAVAPLPIELFADIELNEPLTQPTTQPLRETRQPVDTGRLFGDFDDEEQINVGSVAAVSSSRSETQSPQPTAAETYSIESMLHSEIVSLSSFAADTIQVQAEAEMEPESFKATENSDEAPTKSGPRPTVVWYDEPAEEESPHYRDDRDIVIISEEIDLEASEREPTRIDMGASRVKVDYQEILSKMRGAKAQ